MSPRRAAVASTAVLVLVLVAAGTLSGTWWLGHGANAQTSPASTPSTPSTASTASTPSTSSTPSTRSAGGSRTATATTRPSVQPTGPGHVVMALGDSVPSGRACGCHPFPEMYGSLLGKRTGGLVTVDNRAVSGLRTSDVVAQLRTPDVQAGVRRADVFLLTIGANDFGDHHDQVVTGTCTTTNTDCVADELETLRTNLASVLAAIRGLRHDRPTTLLVTGYWNVFEDGDVARRAYGDAGLQASLRLTQRANAVISAVSRSEGARYVDLFAPFQSAGQTITSLMAADGDHPDAAGHEVIARALLAAGLPRVA